MQAFKTTLITSVAAFLVGAASVVNSDSAFKFTTAHISGVSLPLTSVARAYRGPDAPAEYLPLGIAKINGKQLAVYAFQNGAKLDDVAGQGQGFADVLDSAGHLMRRFTFRENLNSPPQIIEYVSVPAR